MNIVLLKCERLGQAGYWKLFPQTWTPHHPRPLAENGVRAGILITFEYGEHGWYPRPIPVLEYLETNLKAACDYRKRNLHCHGYSEC